MSTVDEWATREAEKRWPISRDRFGKLSRDQAAENAFLRAGFCEGVTALGDLLLSKESVERLATRILTKITEDKE